MTIGSDGTNYGFNTGSAEAYGGQGFGFDPSPTTSPFITSTRATLDSYKPTGAAAGYAQRSNLWDTATSGLNPDNAGLRGFDSSASGSGAELMRDPSASYGGSWWERAKGFLGSPGVTDSLKDFGDGAAKRPPADLSSGLIPQQKGVDFRASDAFASSLMASGVPRTPGLAAIPARAPRSFGGTPTLPTQDRVRDKSNEDRKLKLTTRGNVPTK